MKNDILNRHSLHRVLREERQKQTLLTVVVDRRTHVRSQAVSPLAVIEKTTTATQRSRNDDVEESVGSADSWRGSNENLNTLWS
ncbi:hypothetical protein L596_006402 [Steinernema carpocapsae]|uniref:Uncharacterized protein n=1 Tax=Steinernema carpocapsae TaxID=34508 RepID=A0A4U8V3W0_STECR|nr:hypothetical protein L596_006402 [Steinernema carpocapsae]